MREQCSPSLANCSLPSAWPVNVVGRCVDPAMFFAVCDFAALYRAALCAARVEVSAAVSSSDGGIWGVSDPLTAMNRCALSSASWLARPHANGSSRRVRAQRDTLTRGDSAVKVAIYARYSSDNQRDASIADQLRVCREFAARQGWTVVQEFTDHAISGATLLRSGFQALMRDALNGRFDVVLAEALDRFSRDQEDTAGLFKRLTFAGVNIVTLDLPRARLRAYRPETSIAEKTEAMVRLALANSRMKDFFDIHRLAETRTFDGEMLRLAVAATFTRRGTTIPGERPLALASEFADDAQKKVQWAAFVRRARRPELADLPAIIATLDRFLWPVLQAAARREPWPLTWSKGGPWREL